MKRSFWFAAGAATGMYGAVRVKRVLEIFTVDGLRDRMNAAVVGARMMREEFEQGMTDAETDLRERYDVAADKAAGRERALRAGLDTPSLVPRDGYSTNDDTKRGTD